MNNKERLELFLSELTKLTNKHQIEISGCGCCDSPYLIDLKDSENHLEGQLSIRSWDGSKIENYKLS
jgi:hypothetical protein